MIQQNARRFQPVVVDGSLGRVYKLRKTVMNSARLISDRVRVPSNNPNGWRYSARMITLTYRDDVQWESEHISRFLETMQKWAMRKIGQPMPYVWVMELTKKGRPHFHILVWCPSRLQIPKPDKQGWWKHGSKKAGSRVEVVKNAVGYIAKYASKCANGFGSFPKGARTFGRGGMTDAECRVVNWWNLPKFLRTGTEGSVAFSRAMGGGWRNRDTGEISFSDYSCEWLEGTIVRIEIDKRTREQKEYARAFALNKAIFSKGVRRVLGKVRRITDDLWQAMREAYEDRKWRENLNISEYLAEAQQTDLYKYWSVFEAAERGVLSSAAIRGI